MAVTAQRYVCQECGAAHGKWAGRCESCGGWNSVVEELSRESAPKGLGKGAGCKIELVPLQGGEAEAPRIVVQ